MSQITSRIVFWEPTASPHKLGLFAALSRKLPHIQIICVADAYISKGRLELGWSSIPSPDGFELIVSPNQNLIGKLVRECPRNSFHVLSGIRHVPTIVTALRYIKIVDARFALMSEPRVREGWKGLLRSAQSILTEGWLRRNAKFVLAIGANGPDWFRSVGYRSNTIFPFGYFVDPSHTSHTSTLDANSTTNRLRIGYLGRLVREKGIFDLLNACSMLSCDYELNIAGEGESRSSLEAIASGLAKPVNFLGPIPMQKTSLFLRNLDVLVLASTTENDGWGVVVSEALLAGTAVIVTHKVGASLVLNSNKGLGLTVKPNSPSCLANAISSYAADVNGLRSGSSTRRRWAEGCLSANAGADYFIDILHWATCSNVARPKMFFERDILEFNDNSTSIDSESPSDIGGSGHGAV